MTATMDVSPEVAAYLAAVRDALADLPAGERDELLADVEASLIETASETDAPIAARLGQPEAFASELRAAAGLQARTTRGQDAARAREAVRRALESSTVVRGRTLALELAPIWWVARAFIALASLALVLGADGSVTVGQSGVVSAAAAFAVAAAISVGLGLWGRRRAQLRPYLTVMNVILAFAALPALANAPDWLARPAAVIVETAPAGLVHDGERVRNIYPYSRDGRLLHDVLLYDADGRPLNVGAGVPDPDRRVLRTRGNRAIFNSFPIRYYEPGTRRVARPNAGPRIRAPRIVTPPLRIAPARRR